MRAGRALGTITCMERTQRSRPVVTGLVTAAGCLAAALPASGAGAAADVAPLRDGNWAGTMSVGAALDFSTGGTALVSTGSGRGRFHLLLTGGVGSGEYAVEATGSADLEATGSTGHATAVGSILGGVQGTASAPILVPGGAHFDVSGSVTVDGFTQPFQVPIDVGPEEMVPSSLVITSSSCTYASGTWAHEMEEAVQAAGAAVTRFQGSWAATYTGAAAAAPDAVLGDLLDSGEAVLSQWFATGTFDAEAMEQVLTDAEHHAVAAIPNEDCAAGAPLEWASPLGGMVDRLLTAMASSPSTTAEHIRFGVAAGLRTGVLPSIDSPLEGLLEAKATQIFEAAVEADDTASITLVAIAATAMHWTELASAATEAVAP